MTFTEILDEYEIETAPEGHHHSRQGWVQFDCPKCGKDSGKFHMGYSLDGGYCNCWSCGFADIVGVLQELTDLPFHKIKELLKDIDVEYVDVVRVKGKLTLPKGIKPLSELKQHKKYLKERRFKWQKLDRLWNIQGLEIASDYAWRLFIPIIYHGEVVSWTTRTISSDPTITRYLSSPPEKEAINHKELLYGEDYARQAIVIVEGPTDVWRIGPGAVATMGVGYSQAQVNRMLRFPIRAICFDSEPTAQKRAKELRNALLGLGGDTCNIVLETGKDAGDASWKEVRDIRNEILK